MLQIPDDSSTSWCGKARALFEPTVVIVCTLVLTIFVVGLCALIVSGNNPVGRDVVSFWAAGQQLVHHANPYDSSTVLQIERSVGFSQQSQVLLMRNPPYALCLVIPLGFFGLRAGSLLWSLLLLAAMVLSVHILWQLQGRLCNKLHCLAYSFAPALLCILGGQTALFALLGLVLFLHFHQDHPFVAGLSLWLCALKPHLFLPFAAVLLLWIVIRRAYGVLGGLAFALAASSLIAWLLNPLVWIQYVQMMRSSGIQDEFIPCLSVALRFTIHRQALALQLLPVFVACVWAIYFFWKRRDRWDWVQDGALLMLLSLFASPYAWITDQAVLIPALLVGIYRATTHVQLGTLALASAAIELTQVLGANLHSAVYLWTSPFWLAWYLYISAKAHAQDSRCSL